MEANRGPGAFTSWGGSSSLPAAARPGPRLTETTAAKRKGRRMNDPHLVTAGAALPTDAQPIEEESTIEKAIETLSNGVRGYQAAARHLDDPTLVALFTELGAARKSTTEAVIRAATDAGMEIDVASDSDGTIPGALHRGWIAVEGVVSGDAGIVEAAHSGESHAVEQLSGLLDTTLPEGIAGALRGAIEDVNAAKSHLEARLAPAD